MKKNTARLLLVFVVISQITFVQSVSSETVQESPKIDLISVEELKAKVVANSPVTIIDVRATSGYIDSTSKIKGAIHVKLRRLRSRLAMSPLKDVPRDQEVVTYCACPADESSIEAAKILLENGFKNVRALKGGWQQWLKINGPVDAKPKGT